MSCIYHRIPVRQHIPAQAGILLIKGRDPKPSLGCELFGFLGTGV